MGFIGLNGPSNSNIRKEVREEQPVARTHKITRPLSFGFAEYGNKPDGESILPEYLIRITSFKHKCSVVGLMQEDINLRVESRWEPFIPVTLLNQGNILVQALSGGRRSLVTRATSRRLWMGSSPMTISLKLRFEAIEDAFNEVVEPGRILLSMAIPSDPSSDVGDLGEILQDVKNLDFGSAISKLPTLQPPGPSPFSLENILGGQKNYSNLSQRDIRNNLSGGDFIMIEIGRFLTFWNVIIREDSINYKVKMTDEGDPISSEAEIIIETYEMPTIESLKESYQKKTTSKIDRK